MKKELPRQALHLIFGLIYIALILFFGRMDALLLISVIFFFGALLSWLAIKEIHLPFFRVILEMVEREEEKHVPGKGALMLTIGCLLALTIFSDEKVIVGSIIVLVFGDAVSTLIGRLHGKTKLINHQKSFEGSLAFLIVSFVALMTFQLNWFIALSVALIGTITELAPIDDNLTIPIVCGLALMILL